MIIKTKQGNPLVIILHYFAFLQHTKYTIYLSTVVDASELFLKVPADYKRQKQRTFCIFTAHKNMLFALQLL